MKVLIINKFLYPNGGSETYIFKLGEYLKEQGHKVQYFGMEHEGRCVGNDVNSYTTEMDFHSGSKLSKFLYPIKTIYSSEARKKLRLVLDDFKPDVCHLNNFNYQLTPSIIMEIVRWRKKSKYNCKIVYTAHDYQMICPNHMCNDPNTHENCEKCLGGHFLHCTKGKCIHGSIVKSVIGTMEAVFWNSLGIYKYIDTIICCSHFMKTKMDSNPVFARKTIVLHNFIDFAPVKQAEKKDYVLYFGRYSEEKGIKTLLEVCRRLPDIPFIFAGMGPLTGALAEVSNVTDVGFKNGDELINLIKEARFSVYPSEWYENCPFSVMESQMLGTPVIGSDIGGIPELITKGESGDTFSYGNVDELEERVRYFWENPDIVNELSAKCRRIKRNNIETYSNRLIKIYRGI